MSTPGRNARETNGDGERKWKTFPELFREEQQAILDARLSEVEQRHPRTTRAADAQPEKPDSRERLQAIQESVEQDQHRDAEQFDTEVVNLEWLRRSCEKPQGEKHPEWFEGHAFSHLHSPWHEPFVTYNSSDSVGLGLSGGGIRSATFNLGLLQGLSDLKLLSMFDYVSTVSGGGYIGGFWTAWRRRLASNPTDYFPERRDDREAEEMRHLREFGNFLTPQLGFFQSDLWQGIVAILSGMIPTLTMAVSLILLVVAVWIALGFLFVGFVGLGIRAGVPGAVVMVFAVTALLVYPERTWRARTLMRDEKSASESDYRRFVITAAGVAAAAMFVVAIGLPTFEKWLLQTAGTAAPSTSPVAIRVSASTEAEDLRVDASLDGQVIPERAPGVIPRWNENSTQNYFPAFVRRLTAAASVPSNRKLYPIPNPWLFAPIAALLASAIVLLLWRHLISWQVLRPESAKATEDNRPWIAANSRALGRLLIAAILWGLLCLLWETGRWLFAGDRNIWPAIASMLTSGTVFAMLREWMAARPGEPNTGTFSSIIKPLIPQLLAYLTVALATLLVMRWVAAILAPPLHANTVWAIPAICAYVVLLASFLVLWLVKPEALGLHAFYRDRIARTYLGASNPGLQRPTTGGSSSPAAEYNRQTVVHTGDDIRLDHLRSRCEKETRIEDPQRPLHLVCCGANDLVGDQRANLGHGARSAVLSPFGFAIGNACAERNQVTLGAALTASAAAFNPVMGRVSVQLGPAVSFLLAALNLRLGLWVRHPLVDNTQPALRGWRIVQEMLSFTNAAEVRSNPHDALETAKPIARNVHLSDGNHFENLGLYELVRRHCRFIVVSDCGADPDVAFDDLGNVLRRIRSDFGVEIEIDVEPLKADDQGFARQHMVVGTIHYDRKYDKGILLYFKPGLTGDEPPDVLQYNTRNEQFPHETTIDQFYDEAQWEAYRRLGEHAARSSLRFVEGMRADRELGEYVGAAQSVRVFTEAFWNWYPTPANLEQNMLAQTERFVQLQDRLRTERVWKLVDEMFPEVRLGPYPASAEPNRERDETDADGNEHDHPADDHELLPLLTEIVQAMEDAYLALKLETHWNHPLNLGWMNLFQRWATAPTFRNWWPILQPLYSRAFRQFMNTHFCLSNRAPGRLRPDTVKQRGYVQGVSGKIDTFAADPVGTIHELGKIDRPYSLWWKHRLCVRNPEDEVIVFRFTIPIMEDSEQPRVTLGMALVTLTGPDGGAGGDREPPQEKPERIATWSNVDLFVPHGMWGTGIGTVFLREILRQLRDEQNSGNIAHCKVTLEEYDECWHEIDDAQDGQNESKELSISDQAHRAAQADLIRFYKAAGFRLVRRTQEGPLFLLYQFKPDAN